MRVITLNDNEFAMACVGLQNVCAGFEPDLILGIATGGVYVSQHMFSDILHVQVCCQRRGTGFKLQTRLVRCLLRVMPKSLADFLRIAEASLRGFLPSKRRPVKVDEEVLPAIIRAKRILVVDDAVDSGATLSSVCSEVKRLMRHDAEIATCAITVTTKKPVVTPDYSLYNNLTLIRFPWSADA